MFQIECRMSETKSSSPMTIWGDWFRYSLPTENGSDCATYLKCVVENSTKSTKENPLYVPKQFRMVYKPEQE